MTKQKAEDGAAVISRTRGQWIEDNGSASMRQSRWTALVYATIGAINTRDSPLLRLPAELRIQIYGYVLGYKYIYPKGPPCFRKPDSWQPWLVCDCDGARDSKSHSRTQACFSKPLHLGLLSTCRQTYSEASPIFWSTNIFCFEDNWVLSRTLDSLMPGYASKIERLRLDMTHMVRHKRWQAGLDVNLTALRGLRQIQLSTHTDQGADALGFGDRIRRAMLTKAVMELFAIRHCLTIIVIRNGYIYARLDRESKIENELLESV